MNGTPDTTKRPIFQEQRGIQVRAKGPRVRLVIRVPKPGDANGAFPKTLRRNAEKTFDTATRQVQTARQNLTRTPSIGDKRSADSTVNQPGTSGQPAGAFLQAHGFPFSARRQTLDEVLTAAEAEPLLISGYNGLHNRQDKIPVANKPSLKKAIERLIRLYAERGRRDEAAQWKGKLAEANKPGAVAPTRTDQIPR